MALAHNGNLTNHLDLRTRLVEEGAIFRSLADSETLVHLIAKSRAETVDEQVLDALSHLVGAFSMALVVRGTLYAARDPRGFRPLILGRKDDGHVVVSETCALDILGAEYVRDLEPGEVIRIEGDRVEQVGRAGLLPLGQLVDAADDRVVVQVFVDLGGLIEEDLDLLDLLLVRPEQANLADGEGLLGGEEEGLVED